jgi:hypothetical protein
MNTEYVTIGQGRAVHLAHTFTFLNGETRLGAKCDKTGFARAQRGRRVHAVKAEAATCKACLRATKEA